MRVMSASSEASARLPDDVDLHARPAARFVRMAMGFEASVTIATDEREANAKSLLAVLALGARRGTSLRLAAEGSDASAAVDALAGCIAGLEEPKPARERLDEAGDLPRVG
jgi:phosphotransferase system HPr (HPr) family protein